MKKTRALLISFLLTLLLAPGMVPATLVDLSDDELSAHSGQALVMMDKQQGTGVSSAVTFYKAGLDAVMEMNANIQKLQLGCGGINGAGCDLDIDNMSLSGNCTTNRAGCSASFTRPFFEFAIKNDNNPATRQVVGFRFSAEKANGMLTFGQNGSTPNGINTISGYMRTTQITGTATTKALTFAGPGDPCRTNPTSCGVGTYTGNLTIKANITILGTSTLITQTDGGRGTGIAVPSLAVPFSSDANGALVYGNRQTSTSVKVTGTVPQINFPASSNTNPNTLLLATVKSCTGGSNCGLIPSGDIRTYANAGGLKNLALESTFTQGLGYIHRVNVTGSPFYLSTQSEQVYWPGSKAENIALPGWWMAFEDPVDLGPLSPAAQVDISPTFPQLITIVNNYFNSNPLALGLGQGWTALTSGYMNVDMPVMDVTGNKVTIALKDLPLSATQDVPSNCWGSAKFC